MSLDVGGVNMQYANAVFALFLFFVLFACNTSQSTKATQQKNSEKTENKQINTSQEQLLSTIPVDGKLRDEHLKMYVSVKIKQEQLRYQQQLSQSQSIEQIDPNFQKYTDKEIEAIAVNEFGFDLQVYFWSKKIIQDTLLVYAGSSPAPDAISLQPGKNVLTHNLSILTKHRDELRFANSYRLKLNISSSRQSALKNISKNQSAVFPKPST